MLTTQHTEEAAHRLMQAERTQEAHAIQHALSPAEAYQRFCQHQAGTTAATQREATRLQALGPAGREDEPQAAHYAATR